jgi:hypothetical protein
VKTSQDNNPTSLIRLICVLLFTLTVAMVSCTTTPTPITTVVKANPTCPCKSSGLVREA